MKNWRFSLAFHFIILQLKMEISVPITKIIYLIKCTNKLDCIDRLIRAYLSTFEFTNSKHYKTEFVFQIINDREVSLEKVETLIKCLHKADYLSRYLSVKGTHALLERHHESTVRRYKTSFEYKEHLLLGCGMSLTRMIDLLNTCNNNLYNDIIRRRLLQKYTEDILSMTNYPNRSIFEAFQNKNISYLKEYHHSMMLVLLRQICRFSNKKELEILTKLHPDLDTEINKWKFKA